MNIAETNEHRGIRSSLRQELRKKGPWPSRACLRPVIFQQLSSKITIVVSRLLNALEK